MNEMQRWLEGLEVHEPQVAHNLFAVFPLTVAETNGRDYLTLKEAIEQGLVTISETGHVPEIFVEVKGEKPVLVVEGEIVTGGLQNRMINISLLLNPGKKHLIHVSCVERGRWHPSYFEFSSEDLLSEPRKDALKFRGSKFLSHFELRASVMRNVLESLLVADKPVADQGRVWYLVSERLTEFDVRSPTHDETEFYRQNEVSIEELLEPMKPIDNQVGAIISIGEKMVSAEIFDHPETWSVLHRKVLSGYAADALVAIRHGKEGTLQSEGAKSFWKSVISAMSGAKVKQATVGLGEYHILDGNELRGFALVHNNLIRHLLVSRNF